MFVLLLLFAVSLVVVIFAGVNLWKCVTQGISSAYGRSYDRADSPIAFWISASCTVFALLMGAAISLVVFFGLIAD